MTSSKGWIIDSYRDQKSLSVSIQYFNLHRENMNLCIKSHSTGKMKGNASSQCGICCCRKQWSQIMCLDFCRTAVALLVTTVISIHSLNPDQNKVLAGSRLQPADFPWQKPVLIFIPENYMGTMKRDHEFELAQVLKESPVQADAPH